MSLTILGTSDMSTVVIVAAYACLAWSVSMLFVQLIGITTLLRNFSSPPRPPVSPTLEPDHVPHVTVIRPVKGLEPQLYECIASSFRQDYPLDKLTIYLCVAETSDPAYPVLTKLVKDFPQHDARVLVETDDPLLHGTEGHINNLGPNPKVRNISRAYREAKGDLIWVIDCNVWIPRVTTGHMVDKLVGLGPCGRPTRPYKFVHQIPLVVDTADFSSARATATTAEYDGQNLMSGTTSPSSTDSSRTVLSEVAKPSLLSRVLSNGGGRLDEMFMATTHAKFYSAINTVGVAPCIVGKSNMFRKSHLDTLTDPALNPSLGATDRRHATGIDYFSDYICEDHLIGDLLFRSHVPGGLGNHGLVLGDFAVQPTDGMSVSAYVARRVRWLRARKWTVIAATLVEPGVESLVCCALLAFATTTIPAFHATLGLPQTWAAAAAVWAAAVTLWMVVDRALFCSLHGGGSIEVDGGTPRFASGALPRPFLQWAATWAARELLALPIWTWAVLLGGTVKWRGKTFLVRMDMSVVETSESGGRRARRLTPDGELGGVMNKNRVD